MQRLNDAVPQVLSQPAGQAPRRTSRVKRWGLVNCWSRGFGTRLEQHSLGQGAAANDVPLTGGFGGGIEVTEQRIWLPRLPEAFHRFRIVHLSDIHHGLFLPPHTVIEAVELTNQLQPDLVALTGDFVTYSRAYIEPVAAMLGRLRARYGVFAVLGNHDFRVGGEHVARALCREGIEVLRNDHTAFRRRGQVLYVAGIDDFGYGANLPQAMRGIPAGSTTLLLAHNPRIIWRAARNGVSLVLSGHTHGGQVNLPLVGTIYGRSPRGMRFRIGWDRLGATQIYVSRGIGTVVLPVRFRCPAEVPHLELRSDAAGFLRIGGEPHRALEPGEPGPALSDDKRNRAALSFVAPAD